MTSNDESLTDVLNFNQTFLNTTVCSGIKVSKILFYLYLYFRG